MVHDEETKIDLLAKTVETGFSAINKQFEKIDERFDLVLHSVAAGFEDVTSRLTRLDQDTNILKQDNRIFHATMVTKEFHISIFQFQVLP